ncbi:MAG: FHA domain-containing protein, partial [Sorangiineae bacterium PRO1]|nr:FHA domain-containing protein [Sorangiineae bacterium PRO1]
MIPGFGKQSITIGSAPHCEIHLGGPGVAAEHARIVHQGGGQLVFVDAGTSQTYANGQPVAPGSSHPFDFRTQFMVGQTPVPNAHPALTLMLMQKGELPVTPGKLVFGREAARANVVVQHSSVSGQHATLTLSPLAITDHGSTSGTWIAGNRLAANQATALDPSALVALGPVPLPVTLAIQ